MLGIALLVSALVTESKVISSITSMLLATLSGLGLFSISSKCSFHLGRAYTSFVNNLLPLFLIMSILLGGSLAAESPCSFLYTFYLQTMSYEPILSQLLHNIFFNPKYLILYSSGTLALNLADLTQTNFCFRPLPSSNLFLFPGRLQVLLFLVQ